MHRVVLDTVVFQHHAAYELVVSPEIVREYRDVLRRPEITRKFRRVVGLDYRRVVGFFEHATVVEPEAVAAVSRDPKDDMFLAAAQAADADYLVSEDEDLLTLEEHGRTKIVNGRAFLTILEENQG